MIACLPVPAWTDLIGQDRVIARLRAAIAQDRVHHAYLFTGGAGAGKRRAAQVLAAALNCLTRPGEGCAECEACAKIEQGIHPDVVTLEREGPSQQVPIETIRREVVARVGLPPHEARVRVFVIEEATALALPSANALLKTLEEPPPRTMFVLATTSPDLLLPTIRSRCQRIVFGPARGVAAGDDAERAARIEALGDELATGAAPGGTLAQRAAEGKGDAPQVLAAAAARLHRDARDQLAAGDVASARVSAERGRRILIWQQALLVHNANPQLALEAVIVELTGVQP
jgi:DNA polymerase III delta' subunit